MRILGIESSCDETAVAVVENGRVIRSSVVASQAALHETYGGVFPEMASRQHIRDVVPTTSRALADAECRLTDIDAIAVTRGPGLAGALLVGVNYAKGLALATGLPLVGVNHLHGHLYSNWLHDSAATLVRHNGATDPPFPHITLIASGGHTDLVLVRGHGDFTLIGATLDDAAGEAFDKAARLLGLGYPGGPALEAAALEGNAHAVALPVSQTENPLDMSFSGLKAALGRVAAGGSSDLTVADMAASFQAAAVRALVQAVVRALHQYPAEEVHLAGGVSANQTLRAALRDAVAVPLRAPPMSLCTDNAAMIAAAAFWMPRDGQGDGGLAMDAQAGLSLVARV